jgi:hypothetical protein
MTRGKKSLATTVIVDCTLIDLHLIMRVYYKMIEVTSSC